MWVSMATWCHIKGVKQRTALWAAATFITANHPMTLIFLSTVTLAGERAL